MANTSLSRTNTSPSASGYKYTFSAWIKRSKITDRQMFWRILNPSAATYYAFMEFQADDKLHFNDYSSNGELDIVTNRLFRDTNSWYHIVAAVDTTQGTASNRLKIYVNGVQETSLSNTSYTLGQNQATTGTASGKTNYVGGDLPNNTRFFDGYMNNVAFVDGTALTPSSFGETDSTSGIWKFKSPSGVTFGNNGFHLKMDNSANLGLDSSGETHNLTLSGNGRQAKDTPTNVYATMNPLDVTKGAGTTVYTNGNTTVSISNSERNASRSSVSFTTGKFYAECKVISVGGDVRVGVMGIDGTIAQPVNFSNNTNPYYFEYGYSYRTSGQKENNNSQSSYGATYTAGDVIGVAFDATNGSITFYKNGATQGVAFSSLSSNTWSFYCTLLGVNQVSWNFGNGYFGTTAISTAGTKGNGSLFEYDVPSGHYALNTKNINTYG